MKHAVCLHPSAYENLSFDWGALTWFASGPLGNSAAMTVGRCVIRPGRENPEHFHPNCEEILHLTRGRILHRIAGADDVPMEAGDTITIPAGIAHNARNVGETDAEMLICFSNANREMRKPQAENA